MPGCASAPDCSKAQHDKLLLRMRVDGHMTIIVSVHLYICQHTAKVKYASGEAYNGHWQHGQRHGHGKWSSAPKAAPRLAPELKGPSAAARRADKEVRETYVGGWVAGKREGHGVAEYADGGRCARCAVTTNMCSHNGNFMQCTGMFALSVGTAAEAIVVAACNPPGDYCWLTWKTCMGHTGTNSSSRSTRRSLLDWRW